MKTKNKLAELQSLFEITHGNKFDMNKMTPCDLIDDAIVFIGRSGKEGGIVEFVKKHEDVVPFESGLITVALGGSALSSFVQARPFYTAQNIDVLRPKQQMSLEVKMYYCLCIEANRFRYSTFGREANRTLKHLLVPDLNCVPSWVDGIVAKTVKGLVLDLESAINV